MEHRCCGTCQAHQYDEVEQDWACDNPNSECYSDFTAYRDVCEEHTGKDE